VKDVEKKEMRRRAIMPPHVPLEDASEVIDLERPDEIVMAHEEAEQLRQCLAEKLSTPRAQENAGASL